MALNDGLVAYYRLDGDTNDSSGNNRHNTHVISGSYVPSKDNWKSDGALRDYIEMPGDTVFTNGVTISFWIRAINDLAGEYTIINKGQPNNGFCLKLNRNCPSYYVKRYYLNPSGFIAEQTSGSTEITRYANNTSDIDHVKISNQKTNILRNSYAKMNIYLKGGNQGNKTVIANDINTNFLLDSNEDIYEPFLRETNWKHIVFSASNITKKANLYVNGIKTMEYETTDNVLYLDQLTDQLTIGNENFDIDEVRIYNRKVLDGDVEIGKKATSEIEELYIYDIYNGYTTPYTSLSIPKITPAINDFVGEARINAVCDDGFYRICYTVDGTEPTYNSNYVNNGECIKIDNSCTLKIKKFLSNNIYSNTIIKTINIENITNINQSLVAKYKFNNSLEENFYDNSYLDFNTIGTGGVTPYYVEDKNFNQSKALRLSNPYNNIYFNSYNRDLFLLNGKFAISFWLKAPELLYNNIENKTEYIFTSKPLDTTDIEATDKFNVYKKYKDGSSKLIFDMKFNPLYGYEDEPKSYVPNKIEVSGYTDNNWHHIVINYVNNMIYIFIDKICVGFTTFTGNLEYVYNNIKLGYQYNPKDSLNIIDELRLYNRPLMMGVNDIELYTVAQSEIKMLYDLGVDPITLSMPYTNNNVFEFLDSTTVDLISPNDAPIYYTLDGSTPDNNSLLYSLPIVITETTTINAICIRVEDTNSPILSLTYKKMLTKLTESNVEKIQNISSNNVVIEIVKNGVKHILYDFNYNSNLAFYIKQEYLENKHPLFNNINNRKINTNDCYLELEIPFTKENVSILDVLDFNKDNNAFQNIIKKDNENVLVNIHPVYKGSDRYFDIELQSCDYVVNVTNNLGFNSDKTIKVTFYPKPFKMYLINNFDNMDILNELNGNLDSGTYSYSIQYFNRFSKGSLSEFKDIVSLDNSKNVIKIKEIPISVEDIIIWKKQGTLIQGYYVLSKEEIRNKEFIDDGNKIFKVFGGNVNSFNQDLYYYNILKFGK